jgi:hypothetical protein
VCDDAVIEMHTMISSAYETLHTCRAQSAAPRHVIGPPTLSYSGGLAGHAVTLLPLLDQGSSSAAAVVSKLHRDVEFTKELVSSEAGQTTNLTVTWMTKWPICTRLGQLM